MTAECGPITLADSDLDLYDLPCLLGRTDLTATTVVTANTGACTGDSMSQCALYAPPQGLLATRIAVLRLNKAIAPLTEGLLALHDMSHCISCLCVIHMCYLPCYMTVDLSLLFMCGCKGYL